MRFVASTKRSVQRRIQSSSLLSSFFVLKLRAQEVKHCWTAWFDDLVPHCRHPQLHRGLLQFQHLHSVLKHDTLGSIQSGSVHLLSKETVTLALWEQTAQQVKDSCHPQAIVIFAPNPMRDTFANAL